MAPRNAPGNCTTREEDSPLHRQGAGPGITLNDRRRKAIDDYIAELKKKARITIDNAVLSKV